MGDDIMTVVVFDVDDTLYDQYETFELAMMQSFQDKDWFRKIPLAQLYRLFRYHSDEMFPETVSGELSLKDMRVRRIQNALKDLDVEVSTKECQTFQDNYYKEQHQLKIHPEITRLLALLNEKGIKTGILTNGPTTHQQLKLDQLGIAKWIDEKTHHISDSIGFSKPDPRAFKVVEMAYFDKDEFIYVGDSYDNDVIGAKNAGWKVLWLNKYNKKLTQEMVQPDYEVTTYKELVDKVLELLQEE